MDEFPCLYKCNARGHVMEWCIQVRPHVQGADTFEIYTRHGQQNGTMIEHVSIIDKGKAKRTPYQQACLEAKSKWTQKHDKELYRPVLTNASDLVQESVPVSMLMRPMLAQTWTQPQPSCTVSTSTTTSKKQKMSLGSGSGWGGAFVQPKYDGVRCLATWNKTTNQIDLQSRQGTPITGLDLIRQELLSLFQTLNLNGTLYLDGELFTREVPFDVLSGLVRQQNKSTSTSTTKKKVPHPCPNPFYRITSMTCIVLKVPWNPLPIDPMDWNN